MIVELGNKACAYWSESEGKLVSHAEVLGGAPTVTTVTVGHTLAETFDYDIDVAAYKSHLYESMFSNEGVTNHVAAGTTKAVKRQVPVHALSEETTEVLDHSGAAALEVVVHPDGSWKKHSFDAKPTWVYSPDDEKFGRIVAEFYGVPYGKPVEVELTHWTKFGPPGTGEPLIPAAAQLVKDIKMLLVNTGRDNWAKTQGMFANVLAQQTATAAGATSITGTGTPFVASGYIGLTVVDNTTGVWANIISNTTSVLTVDRWYNPATPAGTAGSAPGATDKFTIQQTVAPAQFIAASTTNTASVATDTTMAGEITTASGGFLRTQATYTHSAGTNTYTMANTWTANSNDTGSLPYVVARIGLFNSMVTTDAIAMWFETLLNATATITISGDALTATDTITGS